MPLMLTSQGSLPVPRAQISRCSTPRRPSHQIKLLNVRTDIIQTQLLTMWAFPRRIRTAFPPQIVTTWAIAEPVGATGITSCDVYATAHAVLDAVVAWCVCGVCYVGAIWVITCCVCDSGEMRQKNRKEREEDGEHGVVVKIAQRRNCNSATCATSSRRESMMMRGYARSACQCREAEEVGSSACRRRSFKGSVLGLRREDGTNADRLLGCCCMVISLVGCLCHNVGFRTILGIFMEGSWAILMERKYPIVKYQDRDCFRGPL